MLRTLSLFFLFALVPVQAAIYFAHNVSEDSGFINTKKYWNGDSDLCWAATASNMLQWWQNNSSGIPAFVPNGQNESGRTEIYDVFCNNWANTGKGIEIGLRWYLGGNLSIPTIIYTILRKPSLNRRILADTGRDTLHLWDCPLPPGKATALSSAANTSRKATFPSSSVQTSSHFSRMAA